MGDTKEVVEVEVEEVVMSESGDETLDACVRFESQEALLALFLDNEGIDSLLSAVERVALAEVSDATTPKGRTAIGARAKDIGAIKVRIDNARKDHVKDRRDAIKVIDEGGKRLRDGFDAIRDAVKKPSDDWKEEKALVEMIEEALAMDKDIADEKAAAEAWRVAEEEKEALREKVEALEAKEAEEEIKREAREEAERVAQVVLETARLEKERLEKELEEAEEERERLRLKGIQDAKDAEARAEVEAERVRLKDIQDEKDRVAAEAERVRLQGVEDARLEKERVDLAAETERLRLQALADTKKREEAAAEKVRLQGIADEEAAEERRREAAKAAKKERDDAVEAERVRLKKIDDARIAEEAREALAKKAREETKAHRQRCAVVARDALEEEMEMSREKSEELVNLVISGEIPHFTFDLTHREGEGL